MGTEMTKKLIADGKAVLGIEFGSTRIKAVLIDEANAPIAEGAHEWENRLDHGIWTYTLEDIWTGLQDCYADLVKDVQNKYGLVPTSFAAIGISAMMHGYLAFNEKNELLVPFRTWRNTITGQAAEELTELFNYNIPQRWSIAHLYQAILNEEPHVKDIDFVATLAAYVHWQLTGQKVIGVGDASGMFPVDMNTKDYDERMIGLFEEKIASKGVSLKIREIFPASLNAGADAGKLTEAGAKLLDPAGNLQAGIPLCPPEGDAGTGMVATNSVGVRTGNVSAGTSVFGMVVLEKDLSKVYPEIDLVTTPAGDLVAMAHCNTCTSDLNAWVNIFDEFCAAMGFEADKGRLFSVLYNKAMEGEKDCGGLLDYNYLSGEAVTKMEEGRPLFVRTAESRFNLANFMRVHLYASLSVLKYGMDGQSILAAALDCPVTVMSTAGEGGAWGVALLAAYVVRNGGLALDEWLNKEVFHTDDASADTGETIAPDPADVAGFDKYMERYIEGLKIERAAVDHLK